MFETLWKLCFATVFFLHPATGFSRETSQQINFGIVVGGKGTLYDHYANVLKKMSKTEDGAKINVITYQKREKLFKALKQGVVSFSLLNSFTANDLFLGQKGISKIPDIRLVISVKPLVYTLLARKDSGINNPTDLRGKRIPYGFVDQFTVYQRLFEYFLKLNSLDDKVVKIPCPDAEKRNQLLQNQKIDAAFFYRWDPKFSDDSEKWRAVPVVSGSAETRAQPAYPIKITRIGERNVPVFVVRNFLVTTARINDALVIDFARSLLKTEVRIPANWEKGREKYIFSVEGTPYHNAVVKSQNKLF